jgi:hypothetical protein
VLQLLALVLAADAAPVKVIVPDLEAQGVETELAATLTGVVVTRLGQVPGASVLSRGDLSRLLDQEQLRQLVGCAGDAHCAFSAAEQVDAQRLVWGSIGKIGERWVVTLSLLDAQTNTAIRRVTREATATDKLVEAAGAATDALWLEPDAPTEGCIGCGGASSGDPGLQLALKLGNNFMSVFSEGLDVSLFGPSFDLEVGYHVTRRVVISLCAGMSFGKSTDEKTDESGSFQVVPLNLGAQYHFEPLSESVGAYAGGALGVGFVRTAFGGDSDIGTAFSARVQAGLAYALGAGAGVVLEAAYDITATSTSDLNSRPLNGASLKLGIAYGY